MRRHDLTQKKKFLNQSKWLVTIETLITILTTENLNSCHWQLSLTIFVTWQSRVTLDSISNSCNVFFSLFFLHILTFANTTSYNQMNLNSITRLWHVMWNLEISKLLLKSQLCRNQSRRSRKGKSVSFRIGISQNLFLLILIFIIFFNTFRTFQA